MSPEENIDSLTPESIEHVLRELDAQPIWAVRAEGYIQVAQSLDGPEAARIASIAYEFTVPLLADDLPVTAGSDESAKESGQQGTMTLENVLSVLNRAVLLTGNEELLQLHRTYLHTGLRERLARTDYAIGLERSALLADYYIMDFEARADPEAYCALQREITFLEKKAGFVACYACLKGFKYSAKTGEMKPVYGDDCKLQP